MPKNRDFAPLDPLPATWTDSAEEFVSQLVSGFTVVPKPGTGGTVLQVPIPEGYEQVVVGMQGRWRYNRVPVERAVPVGVARSLDLWVTAAASAFVGGSPGEVDNTNYAFALVIAEAGSPPSGAALTRFVGRATWDGSKVVAVDLVVGPASGTARHAGTHAVGGSDPVTPASIGAATPAQVDSAVGSAVGAEAAARASGDENNPTAAQKAALAGTTGSPSTTNRYVTSTDPRMTDSRPLQAHKATHAFGGSDALSPADIRAQPVIGAFSTLPSSPSNGQVARWSPGIPNQTGFGTFLMQFDTGLGRWVRIGIGRFTQYQVGYAAVQPGGGEADSGNAPLYLPTGDWEVEFQSFAGMGFGNGVAAIMDSIPAGGSAWSPLFRHDHDNARGDRNIGTAMLESGEIGSSAGANIALRTRRSGVYGPAGTVTNVVATVRVAPISVPGT